MHCEQPRQLAKTQQIELISIALDIYFVWSENN